jgi:hypothetical protein
VPEEDLLDKTGVPARLVNLGGRQLALHRALGELHPSLATYYEGACWVLDNTGPDRLSLAAHAIREVLDTLPRYVDFPVASSHTTLGTKANNLREEWERLHKRTHCLQDGKWLGEIDASMMRFMQKVDDFFGWMSEQRPRKTTQTANALRALDAIPLPAPLAEQNAISYLAIRNFFVKVAHHSECSEEEFGGWAIAFEVFLLERLVPRTYDDFEAIDRLVNGDESAHA